jgi:hypothetical protein
MLVVHFSFISPYIDLYWRCLFILYLNFVKFFRVFINVSVDIGTMSKGVMIIYGVGGGGGGGCGGGGGGGGGGAPKRKGLAKQNFDFDHDFNYSITCHMKTYPRTYHRKPAL